MIFSGRDPEYTIVNGEKSTRRNIIPRTEFSFDEQRHVALAEW
jgi:hypothetical protein